MNLRSFRFEVSGSGSDCDVEMEMLSDSFSLSEPRRVDDAMLDTSIDERSLSELTSRAARVESDETDSKLWLSGGTMLIVDAAASDFCEVIGTTGVFRGGSGGGVGLITLLCWVSSTSISGASSAISFSADSSGDGVWSGLLEIPLAVLSLDFRGARPVLVV